MSVAYQAMVLFVYILPGVIFRKRISTAGSFRQQRVLTEEIAHSVVYAIAWHGLWLWVCSKLPNNFPRVNIDAAMMHAMGQFGHNQKNLDAAIAAVSGNLPFIVAYFASMIAVSVIVAEILRRGHDGELCIPKSFFSWVSWLQEDEPNHHRHREWKEFLDPAPSGQQAVRILTMVIELGKTPFLFVGSLENVYFGRDGNPERFVLRNVSRRALLPSESNPSESVDGSGMHPIYGNDFVVRASEAKTLNMVLAYVDERQDAISRPEPADDQTVAVPQTVEVPQYFY